MRKLFGISEGFGDKLRYNDNSLFLFLLSTKESVAGYKGTAFCPTSTNLD
jgi:hypothetical protein